MEMAESGHGSQWGREPFPSKTPHFSPSERSGEADAQGALADGGRRRRLEPHLWIARGTQLRLARVPCSRAPRPASPSSLVSEPAQLCSLHASL